MHKHTESTYFLHNQKCINRNKYCLQNATKFIRNIYKLEWISCEKEKKNMILYVIQPFRRYDKIWHDVAYIDNPISVRDSNFDQWQERSAAWNREPWTDRWNFIEPMKNYKNSDSICWQRWSNRNIDERNYRIRNKNNIALKKRKL